VLKVTLKQEHMIRWNGILRMLNSFLLNKVQLQLILTESQKYEYLQKLDEAWPVVEELIRFLTPFELATKDLEVWSKPTLHLIVNRMESLLRHLLVQSEPRSVVDSDGITHVIPADSAGIKTIKQGVFSYN
jgi:hypothetical protein